MRAARTRLNQANPGALQRFTDRHIRRLNIETGILERLYELDRGTTEALVANGFLEELVSPNSIDVEPGRLMDYLRDHEAAIQLVLSCVRSERALTKGLVHQIHATVTRHQATSSAIDPFGERREIPLEKGKFKSQPNNPNRPDGSSHEYAPPLQVVSEMDNLLEWLTGYDNEDPVIVAAWLHHRFTQIHPYQDGTGRVARTLTTLVLVKADLLPSWWTESFVGHTSPRWRPRIVAIYPSSLRSSLVWSERQSSKR